MTTLTTAPRVALALLIAVPITLQPELRRWLEGWGRSRLLVLRRTGNRRSPPALRDRPELIPASAEERSQVRELLFELLEHQGVGGRRQAE